MRVARPAFAYVVAIDGARIELNVQDSHRGQIAAHGDGVSLIGEPGNLFGIVSGTRLLVAKLKALAFSEPREAHKRVSSPHRQDAEALRILEAFIVGAITTSPRGPTFTPSNLHTPALGAPAIPLTSAELSLLQQPRLDVNALLLGVATYGGGTLSADPNALLPRHVAVVGSTGAGKSGFTAAILQQLRMFPGARIIVLDINGEYEQALPPDADRPNEVKLTRLGGLEPTIKIPYYALGRHGIARLLLPSERTQRPALTFALDNLAYVRWDEKRGGAALVDARSVSLYDDCRPDGAQAAFEAIKRLRDRSVPQGETWPTMKSLGALVAESHSTQQRGNSAERSAFLYSNISPLVTRIHRLIEDEQFMAVVDIKGGAPIVAGTLSWRLESQALVSQLFGIDTPPWKIHIINLREVAHDLLPLVLGSLLDLLAFELFARGPGRTFPMLLVLEEAHHYLRSTGADMEAGESLAYERLAKEGRKFGASMWLSTQRPSEMSPTVLGQCGTWFVFRLTGEADLKAVESAAEGVAQWETKQIPGLPRREALAFGTGIPLPTRFYSADADPIPASQDPDFTQWLRPSPAPTSAPRPRRARRPASD